MVKLVVFDADETLWSVERGFASTLVLPLRKVDDDVVVDAAGVRVRLFPGVRGLLEELKRRGVLVSLASANDEEPNKVEMLLELFGIREYFLFPQVCWERKSRSVRKIVELVRGMGVDLEFSEVLFVDDSEYNILDVKGGCPGVKTLQVGRDIAGVAQLLRELDSLI